MYGPLVLSSGQVRKLIRTINNLGIIIRISMLFLHTAKLLSYDDYEAIVKILVKVIQPDCASNFSCMVPMFVSCQTLEKPLK